MCGADDRGMSPVHEAGAFIFDLDGVILDIKPVHGKLIGVLRRVGFAFGFRISKDMAWPRGRDAAKVLRDAGLNKLQRGIYVSTWRWFEFFLRPKASFDANGVIDYLKSRGKLVGVITNRSSRTGKRVIKRSGLDWRKLDFIVTQENCGRTPWIKLPNQYYSHSAKPDAGAADPVRHLLENLRGYPQSVFYVGDNLVDLEFARNNDFSFIGVLSGDTDSDGWRRAARLPRPTCLKATQAGGPTPQAQASGGQGAVRFIRDISELKSFLIF